MKCSLVITTYNFKEALEVVLLSILKQTIYPNEIIIADDGSGDDTRQLINKFVSQCKLPIIHSWQEDDGFRAAASRNKAIAKASYAYIILIDGDMILHRDFIKDHLFNAQKGYFIQGSRVLLKEDKSQEVLKKKVTTFSFFERGLDNRKNAIKFKLLTNILSYGTKKLRGIKTCNISFFREDCMSVNGFNEDFVGWGREDSEFVIRLMNKKIFRKNIKFSAIAYHIYHNESSKKTLDKNDAILENTFSKKLIFCQNGIDKYI